MTNHTLRMTPEAMLLVLEHGKRFEVNDGLPAGCTVKRVELEGEAPQQTVVVHFTAKGKKPRHYSPTITGIDS